MTYANARPTKKHKGHQEGLITAIAVGGTFIVIGLLFAINPGLPGKIVDFFSDLTIAIFPPSAETTSHFMLPAPTNPAEHQLFFNALFQLALGVTVLQFIIMPLRLYIKSNADKISETLGNLIFWLGVAILINVFLGAGTIFAWWQFWGSFILLIGFSLIARAIVYAVKK